MPLLNSHRQETFAQAVARGIAPKEAAGLAGYSLHSACCIAAQLMRQEKVSERIRELREKPPTVPMEQLTVRTPAGQMQAVTITDPAGRTLGIFIPVGAFTEQSLNRV